MTAGRKAEFWASITTSEGKTITVGAPPENPDSNKVSSPLSPDPFPARFDQPAIRQSFGAGRVFGSATGTVGIRGVRQKIKFDAQDRIWNSVQPTPAGNKLVTVGKRRYGGPLGLFPVGETAISKLIIKD